MVDILVDKGRSERIGLILKGHLEGVIVVVGIWCFRNWEFEKKFSLFETCVVERVVELFCVTHLIVVIVTA